MAAQHKTSTGGTLPGTGSLVTAIPSAACDTVVWATGVGGAVFAWAIGDPAEQQAFPLLRLVQLLHMSSGDGSEGNLTGIAHAIKCDVL
jgi:hypothetical protein